MSAPATTHAEIKTIVNRITHDGSANQNLLDESRVLHENSDAAIAAYARRERSSDRHASNQDVHDQLMDAAMVLHTRMRIHDLASTTFRGLSMIGPEILGPERNQLQDRHQSQLHYNARMKCGDRWAELMSMAAVLRREYDAGHHRVS